MVVPLQGYSDVSEVLVEVRERDSLMGRSGEAAEVGRVHAEIWYG
jgi:hypothetical protein